MGLQREEKAIIVSDYIRSRSNTVCVCVCAGIGLTVSKEQIPAMLLPTTMNV